MAKQQLLDALDHLKRWELNGCQIRDVITMAQSWTLVEKRMTEALGLQHIELVAGQTPRVQYFFDEDYRESRFKLGGIKGRAFVEKRIGVEDSIWDQRIYRGERVSGKERPEILSLDEVCSPPSLLE